MRKLVIFILLLSITLFFYAEIGEKEASKKTSKKVRLGKTVPGDIEPITLKNKKPRHGGYGATTIKLTQVNGQSATLFGGRGGYIYNKRFSIGGGGYVLLNNIDTSQGYTTVPANIEMVYGGLILEWIINSRKLFHFSLSSLFGGGVAASENLFWDYLMKRDETENFFVIEPEINLMLNAARHIRIGISVSYRLITGVNCDWASSKDLSGFSGGLIFKYGWF